MCLPNKKILGKVYTLDEWMERKLELLNFLFYMILKSMGLWEYTYTHTLYISVLLKH